MNDFASAMRALDGGNAEAALHIANGMIQAEDAKRKASGYRCRGLVYETGGVNFPRNLDEALFSFKQADAMFSSSVSMCHLARVYMKKGEIYYDIAFIYLESAENHDMIPEVLLGFAHYYQLAPQINIPRAKKFYLRAASMGSFAGFFGYSKLARAEGQYFRALLMDCLRIFTGPFIALFIRKRAQAIF